MLASSVAGLACLDFDGCLTRRDGEAESEADMRKWSWFGSKRIKLC